MRVTVLPMTDVRLTDVRLDRLALRAWMTGNRGGPYMIHQRVSLHSGVSDIRDDRLPGKEIALGNSGEERLDLLIRRGSRILSGRPEVKLLGLARRRVEKG